MPPPSSAARVRSLPGRRPSEAPPQRRAPCLAELPDLLTIEEAAAVLRISRGAAYALARRWRESDGREGLPHVMLGRSLRVPKAALLRYLDVGGPAEGRGPDSRRR